MKIHTLTATCLMVLISLSACKKDQTALEIEILRDQARSVELSQKMRLLEMRWERLAPNHDQTEVVVADAEKLTGSLIKMRLEREQLTADVAKLENDLVVAAQKHKNHVRLSSIGKTFVKFPAKHRVYEDVTVVNVDDMGIQIRHKDGLSRVTASKLTLAQMNEFGIDPDVAQQAQLDEAKKIAAYNHMVDTALAKQQKEARLAAANAPILAAAPVVTTPRSSRPSNFGKMTSSFSSPYGSTSRYSRYRDSYYTGPTIYYYGSSSNSRSSYSNSSQSCPAPRQPDAPPPSLPRAIPY